MRWSPHMFTICSCFLHLVLLGSGRSQSSIFIPLPSRPSRRGSSDAATLPAPGGGTFNHMVWRERQSSILNFRQLRQTSPSSTSPTSCATHGTRHFRHVRQLPHPNENHATHQLYYDSSPAVAGEGDRAKHGGGGSSAQGPLHRLTAVPLPANPRGGWRLRVKQNAANRFHPRTRQRTSLRSAYDTGGLINLRSCE